MRVFLNLESGVTRGPTPNGGEDPENARQGANSAKRQGNRLKAKNQEVSRLKEELRALEDPEAARTPLLPGPEHYTEQAENLRNVRQHVSEQRKMLRGKNTEIFQLKNELRAVKERLERIPGGQAAALAPDPASGALPDFIVIGARKCGTTTLYHLLTQHPLVEHAARKELHFFDNHFEKGVEWYRRCFPSPQQRDGRRTVIGEATPKYLYHPAVPERAAEVVPEAKLIAVLRDPVDRAYSDYHGHVRNGRETRRFEEAVEAEMAYLIDRGNRLPELDDTPPPSEYLSGGIYVDQLQRWSRHFDKEQMLVLQSEDFFERTPEHLRRVLDFLGLPEWEPETLEARNEGNYSRGMDPETRRRLREYFEPHNQRLYEYLGANFGW